jgi:hypothetical protein
MPISDTHPEAARYQVQLSREASVAQRFARVRSLSASVAALSRRALARTLVDPTEHEIGIAFVALHYGEATARQVRENSISQ